MGTRSPWTTRWKPGIAVAVPTPVVDIADGARR